MQVFVQLEQNSECCRLKYYPQLFDASCRQCNEYTCVHVAVLMFADVSCLQCTVIVWVQFAKLSPCGTQKIRTKPLSHSDCNHQPTASPTCLLLLRHTPSYGCSFSNKNTTSEPECVNAVIMSVQIRVEKRQSLDVLVVCVGLQHRTSNPKLVILLCVPFVFLSVSLSLSLLSGLSHQDYSSILLSFPTHNSKGCALSFPLAFSVPTNEQLLYHSRCPRQRLRKPLLVVTSVPCSADNYWDVWSSHLCSFLFLFLFLSFH